MSDEPPIALEYAVTRDEVDHGISLMLGGLATRIINSPVLLPAAWVSAVCVYGVVRATAPGFIAWAVTVVLLINAFLDDFRRPRLKGGRYRVVGVPVRMVFTQNGILTEATGSKSNVQWGHFDLMAEDDVVFALVRGSLFIPLPKRAMMPDEQERFRELATRMIAQAKQEAKDAKAAARTQTPTPEA